MEYLEMGDLDAYLKTNPPIPEDETKEVARQILEGLEFMHGNGFAHRDMKPDVGSRPCSCIESFLCQVY
jgi:calcium/calmodulin-dependent protein kinase I